MKYKIEVFVRGRSVLVIDDKSLQHQLQEYGGYVQVYHYHTDLTIEVTTEEK